jgi:hypothetical protein
MVPLIKAGRGKDVDWEKKTLGTFNHSTTAGFIKKGTSVRFFVEGGYKHRRDGVAVILVWGRLDSSKEASEQEEEEEGA